MLPILSHVAGSKRASMFEIFPTQMFAMCDVAVVGAGAKNKIRVFAEVSKNW